MFLFTAMAAALVLCSTVAFAALRTGTDEGETLTGTNKADKLNGLGGNDLLQGRAGSDVYLFDDGFGEDTLEEATKYGKRSGGSDSVDFSEVNDSYVRIGLVPEYDKFFEGGGCLGEGTGDCSEARALGFNREVNGKVDFSQTTPERATGSTQDGDMIIGGKEKNVLRGGPGLDYLGDLGGVPAENSAGLPALAASDDTFIAGEDGDDAVVDFAGKADKLDLRAMGKFSEVGIAKVPSGAGIHLVFTKPDTTSNMVVVQGGVAPLSEDQQNGVMEKVVFADGTRSAAQVLAKAEDPAEEAQEVSSGASSSSSAIDQQQLVERAKKLVEEAQAALPLFFPNGAATK